MNTAEWWAAFLRAEADYREAERALEQRRKALQALVSRGVANRYVSQAAAADTLHMSRGRLRRFIGKDA